MSFVGYRRDQYDAVHIDLRTLEGEYPAAAFELDLAEALKVAEKTCKSMWLYLLPIPHASLIPAAIKLGLSFHHATAAVVTMTKWLLKDMEVKLPRFPFTYVGVGGLVLHEGKILVVIEKYRKEKFWKLPGGYANQGEELYETAIREVREESGIETEFKSLLALRHSHIGSFGNSDLFFVCSLAAKTTKITCDYNELDDCTWMDVEVFLAHEKVNELNKMLVRCALEEKSTGLAIQNVKIMNMRAYQEVYSVHAKANPTTPPALAHTSAPYTITSTHETTSVPTSASHVPPAPT